MHKEYNQFLFPKQNETETMDLLSEDEHFASAVDMSLFKTLSLSRISHFIIFRSWDTSCGK